AFDGSILSFWEPSSLGPGVTGRFNLTMDLDQIAAPFGIRQVATTIPGRVPRGGVGATALCRS
ncbi:MAG: hypothetical protein MI921_19375, partial [Cytophagales bacterium]|nr:hypothetical protein [Cytophagales bacterium]